MSALDFIITELNTGGAERALTELAIGCASAGDDVRVFSIGSPPEPPRDALVVKLCEAGIGVTFANSDRTSRSLLAAMHLRSWLRKRPDAIRQSFLFHANVLLAAVAPPGDRLIAGIRVAQRKNLRTIAERAALQKFDRVVSVSSAVDRFVATQLRVSHGRRLVIPNGVDPNRWIHVQPADWATIDWPIDAEVLIFIGRFHSQKGIELIQRQLDTFIPTASRRRLLLIGDGPLKNDLKDWAASTEGRVQILNWQPDVAPYLAASKLLVLPSHYEGMPNVVLEAMAAGKPVVCSRVEGSHELIGDDPVQGFPPGDDHAMAQRIDQLFIDPNLQQSIGLSNRQKVADRFTLESMVNAYRNLYQQPRVVD